jgi:hypothetical protein
MGTWNRDHEHGFRRLSKIRRPSRPRTMTHPSAGRASLLPASGRAAIGSDNAT